MLPLVPLNEASVVIVPLPGASSKTVPSFVGASPSRRAVEIAAAVHDQAGIGEAAVGAVERSQRGDRAAAWASSNTVPSSSAPPPIGRAVQIAAAVHDQAGIRVVAVGAVERSERGDRAAALGQLEDRAVSRWPRRHASCRTGCRCCP